MNKTHQDILFLQRSRMIFPGIFFLLASLMLIHPVNTHAKTLKSVYVSILPQKYFVERIAGKNIEVNVLVKPGKSPTTYSPSPNQIKKLAASDIYFRIGVPFENGFMHKIASIAEAIEIVDTRQGIVFRMMKPPSHNNTAQGDTGQKEMDHDPKGQDHHIWMSPLLVKKQAHTMAEAFIRFDPENKSMYELNLNKFIRDLDVLHEKLAAKLFRFKGENLFVFHPVFGYFTDAYGMNQVAIETMGKAPKGKELSSIIKLVKQEKVRVIFTQPQFDRHTAQNIASAIKGTIVSIDPLALDYLANMETIADTIASALKQ
jgi:zinc transport system substrate-binding protein